ncbi:tryptophan-rich sensory protein [Hoeflea sp. G2-23]|uniref:Tryptophan-rich sensory protein n=1 Tax=Hoeflea algicola TaxID=2983763 RepID=A0ABT3ZBQ9_9HYPH|nr:TspO/MBR family protein [Hoeflea algicola]MCY0149153.1 tryptophan-rich sensory protein [Hoeflea algicola]
MTKSHALTLILFVVLTVAAGSLVGYSSIPGPWYQDLQKPAFNPPNWIFGPVWTALYVLIGIAGARVYIRERGNWLPKIWFLQMALNLVWSPIFFTLHRPDLALAVLVAMLLAILTFIAMAWSRDRPSALLFLPYAAWVSFAGLLNGAIWWLNPL